MPCSRRQPRAPMVFLCVAGRRRERTRTDREPLRRRSPSPWRDLAAATHLEPRSSADDERRSDGCAKRRCCCCCCFARAVAGCQRTRAGGGVVDRQALLGLATEEGVDRLVAEDAEQIPDGEVDGGDALQRQALAAVVDGRPPHLVPHQLDCRNKTPHQSRRGDVWRAGGGGQQRREGSPSRGSWPSQKRLRCFSTM